jgi:hypothetical protein
MSFLSSGCRQTIEWRDLHKRYCDSVSIIDSQRGRVLIDAAEAIRRMPPPASDAIPSEAESFMHQCYDVESAVRDAGGYIVAFRDGSAPIVSLRPDTELNAAGISEPFATSSVFANLASFRLGCDKPVNLAQSSQKLEALAKEATAAISDAVTKCRATGWTQDGK